VESNHNCSSICLANSADRLIGLLSMLVVQTGLEPASHTLERRAARPLRFCTIDAVQVEKAVDSHTGIEPALTVFETVALPFGEYVSFSDEGTTTHRLGFEPRTTVLETEMLPLHHLRIGRSGGS
jgi:hypothetical protein